MLLSALAILSAQPVDLDATTREIERLDAQLFHAAFEGCDPDMIGTILDEDYRMLHDLAGVAITSRAEFVSDMQKQCAARAPGGEQEGYANRRTLVPGSRRVQLLGDWGALEEAYHTFSERQADGSWKVTGGGRYIHVWRRSEEGLKLNQTLSIDHGPVYEYTSTEE